MGYVYAARGDSYAALDEYETAIANYAQAIAIYPYYVSALYTWGCAYAALGETALAVADHAKAIEQITSRDAFQHTVTGRSARRFGQAVVDMRNLAISDCQVPRPHGACNSGQFNPTDFASTRRITETVVGDVEGAIGAEGHRRG